MAAKLQIIHNIDSSICSLDSINCSKDSLKKVFFCYSPNLGRKSCKLGPIYCIVQIRCITMHYHVVTSDDEGKDVIVCGLSENSL